MPPIPTFQSAPLHADGATPKTADAQPPSQAAPASNEVPQPTRTIPLATQATDTSGPPPPQPGALPQPGPAPTASYAQSPPAPMPGANPNYTPPAPAVTATVTSTTTSTVPRPPQLDMSSPSSRHTPSKSTSAIAPSNSHHRSVSSSTYSFPSSPITPSSVNSNQRHSLEHPPGYVQNPYAADGTANDRARYMAAADGEEGDDIWSTMRSAAKQMGKYAQKVEKDAWEWIDTKGFR